MNIDEVARWHQLREELFAKPNGARLVLDASTIATMVEALPAMQCDAAMESLHTYRNAKPYRGFWWRTYLEHYGKAKTDSGLRAAAASPPDHMEALLYEQAKHEQRQEHADYAALPSDFKADCRKRFAEWGIPIDEANRKWRLLCIDAHRGIDVSVYRVHRSESYQPPVKPLRNPYSIIEELRLQVASLEERLAVAEGRTKLQA
jgi:hypothetical protein